MSLLQFSNSKKNSFRGNYMRKYGIPKHECRALTVNSSCVQILMLRTFSIIGKKNFNSVKWIICQFLIRCWMKLRFFSRLVSCSIFHILAQIRSWNCLTWFFTKWLNYHVFKKTLYKTKQKKVKLVRMNHTMDLLNSKYDCSQSHYFIADTNTSYF